MGFVPVGIALTLMPLATFAVNDDPASLDNLVDIVTVPPVSWWPLAPAWYVVIAALLLVIVAALIASHRRRRLNAYRVTARAELDRVEPGPSAVAQIAEILKRTALAAAPRQQVASLSGELWLQWLDRTGNGVTFEKRSRQLLGERLYRGEQIDEQAIDTLLRTARAWIDAHQTGESPGVAKSPGTPE